MISPDRSVAYSHEPVNYTARRIFIAAVAMLGLSGVAITSNVATGGAVVRPIKHAVGIHTDNSQTQETQAKDPIKEFIGPDTVIGKATLQRVLWRDYVEQRGGGEVVIHKPALRTQGPYNNAGDLVTLPDLEKQLNEMGYTLDDLVALKVAGQVYDDDPSHIATVDGKKRGVWDKVGLQKTDGTIDTKGYGSEKFVGTAPATPTS